MPGSYKRKPSNAQEGEWRMTVLGILEESDVALNIEQIKLHDFSLTYLSTSKMARILNYLVDMGLVRKSKNKSTNRMMYMSVAKMVEQGYDVHMPPDYHVGRPERKWNGIPYDIEDALNEIRGNYEGECAE